MKTVNWKVYNEALGALQAQFTEWDCIRIFNTNFARQGTPMKLRVQWGSLGIKSPAEAAEYANRILDAAMAAENFVYNGYVVDYGGGDQRCVDSVQRWAVSSGMKARPSETGTCSGGKPRFTQLAASSALTVAGSQSSGSLSYLPVRFATGRRLPALTVAGAPAH